MTFKDYFSKQADDYVRYRPRYPESLFEYLNSLVREHDTAWDCGTGNGQVALGLTQYFSKVYASDASSQQIANTISHERIEYFVSLAESTSLMSDSLDLITVGQAFHWFDAEAFYREAKRVLKPAGIIAIWCYGQFDIPQASESLKAALQKFYKTIEPFWPSERQLVEDRYRTISFPFAEIEAPTFLMSVEWTVDRVIGYLQTWSSTQRYIAHYGETNIVTLFNQMIECWSYQSKYQLISWPIYLRVGRYI